MNALDVHGASLPIGLAAAFAVLACHAVFAESELDPVANNESQRQLVDEIVALQAHDGAYAEGLIAPFSELARSYEQDGDYGLAIAALDRAAQLVRANRGVNSLDQAEFLQRAIRDEKARGDLGAAWKREDDLLRLADRHPKDLRAVPLFREVAEERMALAALVRAGAEYPEFPPDYCDFGVPRGCRWIALADAWANYGAAIAVLSRNELYSSSELRDLEMRLVRIAELVNEQDEREANRLHRYRRVGSLPLQNPPLMIVDPEFVKRSARGVADRLDYLAPGGADEHAAAGQGEPTGVISTPVSGYEFGRRSLARLYQYTVASAAPAWEQVEAIVQLADWDLRFSRNSLALEGYAQAYEFLKKAGAQDAIDALFSPPLPFVLPAYDPNPLATGTTEPSSGYIDVAFTVTEVGEARRIKFLDATNATDDAKETLATLIKSSRFRPQITDGEFRASPVRVRYYLPGN
ncbi:MAG TPA: hypothetical protein VFO94_04200 [Gammaproteobacteria bacterium]|nr:hypothetical protein [Gammaproteobacteria bacterium]